MEELEKKKKENEERLKKAELEKKKNEVNDANRKSETSNRKDIRSRKDDETETKYERQRNDKDEEETKTKNLEIMTRRMQRRMFRESRRLSLKEIPRKISLADVTCDLQLVETVPDSLIKRGYAKRLPEEHISTYDVILGFFKYM
jgi:hypothetical protein